MGLNRSHNLLGKEPSLELLVRVWEEKTCWHITRSKHPNSFKFQNNLVTMKDDKVCSVCSVCGDKATGIHYRVLSCEVRGRGMSSSFHDYLH